MTTTLTNREVLECDCEAQAFLNTTALYAFIEADSASLETLSDAKFERYVSDFRRHYFGTFASKLDWVRALVSESEDFQHITDRKELRRILASFEAAKDVYFLRTANRGYAVFSTDACGNEFENDWVDTEWSLARDEHGVAIAYSCEVHTFERNVETTINLDALLDALIWE